MTDRNRRPCVAVVIAAVGVSGFSQGVSAADLAGANALQAELNEAIQAAESFLAIGVSPSEPVQVSFEGDAYIVDVAPVTIYGVPVATLEGEPGPVPEWQLSINGFQAALATDASDPDLVNISVAEAPAVAFSMQGNTLATLNAGTLGLDVVWSRVHRQPTAVSVDGRDIELQISFDPISPSLIADQPTFGVSIASLSHICSLVAQRDDLWQILSESAAADFVIWTASDGGSADREDVYRTESITNDLSLSGVPVAAWRDYLHAWVPTLIQAERNNLLLVRRQRIALLSELPALFNDLDLTTTLLNTQSQGMAVARQTQSLRIEGAATDVLSLTSHDEAAGMAYRPMMDSDPDLDQVLAVLVPTGSETSFSLNNVPVGHAWGALVETVDAWIDEPEAAFEVFFLSFSSRAATLGTNGSLALAVAWADAHLEMAVDLAAGRDAVLGVSGTVDAAFDNMGSLSEAFARSSVPEMGAGWSILQALGQQERVEDDGHLLTRYRVDIAPDGTVTFNGRDFGPVLRMVENFFGAFSAGQQSFLPDQD